MKRGLTFLILCIFSFNVTGQEIPKNPNAYDLDSNKTGVWTILYDVDWNVKEIIDSVEFYRIITYEQGVPKGKVVDYYITGHKQWEGYLFSDEPEDIYSGKCEWFNKNGDVIEKRITTEQIREDFYYEQNELLLKVLVKNDTLTSYDIYIRDTLSFPLDMLYILESYDLGDYSKALELDLECLALYAKILGKEHPDYAASLSHIASSYSDLGDYSKALELDLECLVLYEKIYGKEHPDYASSLGNLALNYSAVGDYSKSLELDLECLALKEKIYGKEHLEYTISLSNSALSYSNLGDYSNSLELNLECLALTGEILGKEHPDYTISLSNLALNYSDLGDYSKSLELNLECLALYEKILGKEHPDYASSLNNLALNYSDLGNYSKSLELNLECLALYEKIYGKEHPDYATPLSNLAICYSNLGDYSKSLELNLECLALTEKTLGKEHPNYASSLSNLATSYSDLGDDSKSLKLNLECLALYEKILGKEHPDYALSLYNTGYQYRYLKNYNEAYVFLLEFQKLALLRFTLDEKNLNTNLVRASYNFIFEDYQTLFSISNHLGSSIKIKDQYNKLCFLKGRELSKNTSMVADIYQSDDESLITLHDNWLSINRKISFCYENTLEERKNLGLDIDKLQDDADDLERQLVKRSTIFASNQRDYLFTDIISNLKSNEVYLDIVNIPTYNFVENHIEESKYYVYVIKKAYKTPQVVDLGSEFLLDSIYNYYSTYTQKRPSTKDFSSRDEFFGNKCYTSFWGQLEPYLEGVSTVYFSPEGVYSKINHGVLYDSNSSSFLIDKYNIVYVSNVEDFVHQKENIHLYEQPDNLHAVLIGNPTFLLGEDEVVLATNEYQSRSINQDELDSLQRGIALSNLPGTQVEIDLISDNLKLKGWDVVLISGIDATETKVKSIEAPKILHIATHGFFFQDQEMVKRSNMISTDNKKTVTNPMTRSGLIFSGAENTMNGEMLADDNGWLNSYEASLLNLRGTELVVLSACETGTGDVQNGKGVYGLQRAIKIAGAESIIMSMWKVDDNATQELMTSFYDYWIDKKMTKKKAFNKAQEEIREKYKHPYYWGAFIMLGE